MAKDLNYFKKKIMAILEKQTDDAPAEINKSLNQMDFIYSQMNPSTFSEIEKSRGYGIGTVREWKGRKYKKIAPNKWRLVYESNSRGAKQSIAYLKKAVMNAKSTDELLQIVMENVNRFQDANGKTLDIVSELQEAVRTAKTALNGGKKTFTEKVKEILKPVKGKIAVGDKVTYKGQTGKVVKDFNNGMVFINFDDGSMGRFAAKDVQKVTPTAEEKVTETATENAKKQDINGTNEAVQTEIKDTTSLSEAMRGNQNAKKDFKKEQEKTVEEVAKIEKDKAEFKALIDRYNALEKEFKQNGGWSNRRTTQEEDIKRRAARKEKDEVEKKIAEFRNRLKEENKGSFKIPSVYHDTINEWIKRKVKGQTISSDWLYKKFGGYYSDALAFGDGYSFSLGDTETIDNPSVRINYEDKFKRPGYIVVDLKEMAEKENYRPRYMPNDDETFTEVWKKVNNLKEQLDGATGSTIAEKFFNTVMGVSNAYNESSDTSNIPRYRFTKDGIKDKSGKLEKIDATIREADNGSEYIRLYADSYGASIPSIFYPENNTDMMTDYFEKDSCSVFPDHPYYDHLKLMALKRELYRGRATKWASLSKEQQTEIENQIKDLEKQLTEPTEEELKAYRERRDVQEKNKEIWKEARTRQYQKEMEEKKKKAEKEEAKKFGELLDKFAEALEKEPPVYLGGLSKEEKIQTLEDRIIKLGIEINNLDDEETIQSKKNYREQLKQKLEEVKNESDTEPEETEAEKHENRSNAMLGNDNAAGFRIVQPEENEPVVNYSNLSKDEVVAEYKRLGKEVSRQEKENKELYNKNDGWGKGLDVKDMDPNSDYQKWLKGGEKLRGLMAQVSHLTDSTRDGFSNDERREFLILHDAAYNGKMSDSDAVEDAKKELKDLESQIGQGNGFELDKKLNAARDNVARAEMDEKDARDGIVTPIPRIDSETARRVSDISMSGNAGSVYQHDVNVEMSNFRDKFNVSKMNEQQKSYFQERLNAYAGLVGSSYNEMASKRLAAGPSWVVAGPAKYNTKRFNQKMEAERRAYETFEEKKEKFIKNTEKRLKELKYTGGNDSVEDVKKKVFEDYSRGKWSYGDKIDNTDPYAIEKIQGKIKFMEDSHDVTLLYNKMCKKNGITNWQWADRSDEDRAKRREVLTQTVNAAKEKGYSDEVIKQGIEHPFGSNQTADIRRNKQRLEELQKRQAVIDERKASESNNEGGSGSSVNTGRVDFDGGYIYENPELDRIQIIYDGKPERDVIDKLKHNGFRWSPSQGAWQRQLNRNGRYAVNQIMAETGKNIKIDIDGAGKVEKSLPKYVVKGGRFLIRK